MQPSEEMSHSFWRHGITLHMRVFQLKTCRAIQWWYPGHSGVVYVPHDGKIDPKFDDTVGFNLTTVEAPFVELPAIPEAVDIEQFHLDVKQLTLDVNSEPVDI